jgi:hypothetical protein
MTDNQAPNPAEPEISEEEARAKLEEAVAYVGKQVSKAKKQFAYNIKLAQDRLAYANKEVEGAKEMRSKLEPHRADPEGAHHYNNSELLVRVYSATKRMMELEVGIHKHNLAVVEDLEKKGEEAPDTITGELPLRYPDQDPDYLEARVFLDVHLAMFHVLSHLEGVDLLLRVTSDQKAIEPQSEEEEAQRQAGADALKAAMKDNRELAVLVTQLGNDLAEALALLEWGKATLATIPQLPGPAKKAALEDTDWQKLNGKVVFLGELPAKAQKFPELAGLFPAEEVEPLPYDMVAWADAETAAGGTGRLRGSVGAQGGASGSGRLPNAGTGPIKRQ